MIQILLNENESLCPLLALKYLRNYAGIESVMTLMKLPEIVVPWIKCNRDAIADNELSLTDPFSLNFDKDKYEEICGGVRTAVTTPKAPIPKISDKETGNIFFSAFFSQVIVASKHLKENLIRNSLNTWSQQMEYSLYHKRFFEWITKFATNSDNPLSIDKSSTIDMSILQLIVQCALLSFEMPDSWFSSLTLHPERIALMYIPGNSRSDLAEAVAASGHVGWYTCPRGHPYSVGGCTMPMELSICLHPGCGAQIGGRNHVSVYGVKKLDVTTLEDKVPLGYSFDNSRTGATRYSVLHTQIIRLIVHLCICLGISQTTDRATIKSIRDHFGKTKMGMKELSDLFLIEARENFKEIMRQLELGEGDTTLTIHLILRYIVQNRVCKTITYIPNMREMRKLEESVVIAMKSVLSGIRSRLFSLRGTLSQGSLIASARISLGEQWDLIHEIDENSSRSLETMLWRYREPVTFNYFKRIFDARSDTQKQFPLLFSFLKEEKRLHVIKYTADILAWHSLLFEMFPPNSLSREEAINITNADAIIQKLPKERHTKAFKILYKYCDAFNECLPMIDQIFECEANPFISELNGVVDLSGAKNSSGNGVKMSEDCSINFSLPSMVRGSNDAMGICTIKLLELMQSAQAEVLQSLNRRGSAATTKILLKGAKGACPIIIERDNNNEDEDELSSSISDEIPSMSHLTPLKILKQQLIFYDRQKDLMPLLQIFAKQSLEYGEGIYLDFDFNKIEAALANTLFGGKMPVKIHIRHFQFYGDVKNAGYLASLHLSVPQRPLSHSILETIWTEIDTRDRLIQLMRYVEMCISFIGSITSSTQASIDGSVLLGSYIVNTLMINNDIWSKITTQAISQQVQLCHLQSFYMELEEKMNGSPLDNVEKAYREFMDEKTKRDVRNSIKHLDLTILLPVLRQFLVEQLTETKWEIDASLKEYLTFVSSGMDLDELIWYENYFPESLQLQHAYQLYYYLVEFN